MEEKTKDLLTSIGKWLKIILWIIGIIAVLAFVYFFFASISVGVSPG